MLKFTLLLGFACGGIVHFAQAQTANLEGTYAVKLTTLCQGLGEFQPPFYPLQMGLAPGGMGQSIGLATFVPAAPGALSGTISVTSNSSGGNLMDLLEPGGLGEVDYDLNAATGGESGTYSVIVGSGSSPSTLSVYLSSPQTNFVAYLSHPQSGVFNHIDFISIGTIDYYEHLPSCTTSGSMKLVSAGATKTLTR